MNTKLHASSEFATLVNQLHRSPDDPALKQAVLKRLPEMKALAQVNSLALYRLAQVYPQNSTQYEQMMKQSAAQGCTNAMFAMAELLAKLPSSTDLKKAAEYIVMINKSKDSYMMKQTKTLLESHPKLLQEVQMQSGYSQRTRFFAAKEDRDEYVLPFQASPAF